MTDAAAIADQAGRPQQRAGHGRLQLRILIGFVLGLAAGLIVYATQPDAEWVAGVVTYVTNPIGQIFLRLLFMLVIPLLFSALVVGIAEMGEIRALKNVGLRTLAYTIVVSSIAVAVSLAVVNLIRPGDGVDPVAARELLAQGGEGARGIIAKSGEAKTGVDAVIGIV
ncbi:MAG: cation:dicarboxylase symporter family transporter, partial [Novosphingobium sp.]